MAETFDAYHKWLGIPPHERPPSHYRLLAIDPFESDPDVISSAADQRMAHVRTFQSGRHAALSQSILNEIAAARVCLLNPEKKAEYDQKLRTVLASRQAPPAPGRGEPTSSVPLPQPAFEGTVAGHRVRRRRPLWQSLVAVGVAAAVCGGVIFLVVRGGSPPEVVQVNPAPPVVPPDVPEDPGTPASPDEPDVPPTPKPPETEPGKVSPVEPPVEPPTTPEPPTPDPGTVPEPPVDPTPPPSTPERVPVPDAAAIAAAEAALKVSVDAGNPRRLLSQALALEQPPAESFYLLTQAKRLAAEAGDTVTAMKAEEELLARFEVDPIQTRAETLKTLGQSPAAADVAQAIAQNSLAMIDEAVAAGRAELASELAVLALKSARQAADSALERQATLKILELRTAQPSNTAPEPASADPQPPAPAEPSAAT